MVISTATVKGQVLIPVQLRKKYHIHKGSRLAVLDGDGQIILKPVADDPIEAGMGFLKKFKGKSALKSLQEEKMIERKKGKIADNLDR